MNKPNKVKFGLIGSGSFGRFCLEAISELKEVELFAISDLNERLAKKTARNFKTKWYTDPLKLISDPDVEMIHIVTPPFTHYSLTVASLQQNKHVLCEKPLALSLKEADEMLQLAKQKDKILPVNFILRYVPVTDIVKKVIDSKIFGEPIRAYFENYATDENMAAAHWFWDKRKSGGIFIEHGVHFFDLYCHWFGEAEVIWAHTQKRNSTGREDRVFCFLHHSSGVLANHYHGFDQPKLLDRQIHRLLFERGDIVIHGWVPEWFKIDALVNDYQIKQLEKIFKPTKIHSIKKLNSSEQKIKARGKKISVNQRIQIEYRPNIDKLTLYSEAIKNLVRDQIIFIHNKKHQRVVTEQNGRRALALAISACERGSA